MGKTFFFRQYENARLDRAYRTWTMFDKSPAATRTTAAAGRTRQD